MTLDVRDEVLDAVAAAVEDTPASTSVIARRARVSYSDGHAALKWLTAERFIVAVGNGAWTNYRQRRFGERTTRTP